MMIKGHVDARPWKPQDLIDDLQKMIDEEPDAYLNDRCTTLCTARDYLKEYLGTTATTMIFSLSIVTRCFPASWAKQGTLGT